MPNLDQLGSFYLGRRHDLAAGKTLAEPLLYDSNDLTTHAVCVGMTGSGKTGLCLSLLEEAALDGIPAIAIDPKGDLGNLLLAFPKLAPSDFRPWIEPNEAARQQMSPDEFAASQAELWKKGLDTWDEKPERIEKFVDSVERVIYTPGSSAGIPITVLKSFHAPPPAIVADGDAFHEQIASATSGLLALLGIDADPVRSREHIFLSNVIETSWRVGRDLDLSQLIQQIQRPPFEKIGVVDLESFYSAKERTQLAMSLNNLLASPSFASWLEGEPLDIARMLYTPEGKPRLAIVSIAHLDEPQRMFFVTILLNEVLSWIRTQPGTSSLRAILYMDEVFGYFPPLANPPSKRPMLTLLKQARAYGLGCVLATQNPADLDYKGLSNAGTWFLGRLQTERDKARVMEGLEGASAQAGSTFNRREMEARLAALGNRVFLMNNVHEDAPVVFQTRWAMSYLRGPLTREQIKTLMDPVRSRYVPGSAAVAEADAVAQASPASAAKAAIAVSPANKNRPILPAAIREEFLAVHARVPDGYRLEYRPGLYGTGKAHFRRVADGVDVWRECHVLQTIRETPPDDVWDGAEVDAKALPTSNTPDDLGRFAELPAELSREKSYSIFKRQLAEHLYRTESMKLLRCEALDQMSRPDESADDFRARMSQSASERLEKDRKNLESAFAAKTAKAEANIARYQAKVSAQKWQFFARLGGVLWVVADGAMRALGKGRLGRQRSPEVAIRYAATERGQQASAQADLDKALKEQERLEQEHENELQETETKYRPENLQLEPIELKPLKSDIEIDKVVLVWLPWRVDSEGHAEAVYKMPSSEDAAKKHHEA
ncbi:MAG: ATP-binding protein [Planctomycetes bacterium]|nr:ATP-binding protein [Planctomycetota bacterium]